MEMYKVLLFIIYREQEKRIQAKAECAETGSIDRKLVCKIYNAGIV